MTEHDKIHETSSAAIAHDMRSPLAAIKMFVESIRIELNCGNFTQLLQNLPERLDRIQGQADRLVELIDRFGEDSQGK